MLNPLHETVRAVILTTHTNPKYCQLSNKICYYFDISREDLPFFSLRTKKICRRFHWAGNTPISAMSVQWFLKRILAKWSLCNIIYVQSNPEKRKQLTDESGLKAVKAELRLCGRHCVARDYLFSQISLYKQDRRRRAVMILVFTTHYLTTTAKRYFKIFFWKVYAS